MTDLKTRGQKRIWYPGACYHVMSRGIRRNPVFEEAEDYELFMMILRATQKKMPFTLHSFCLMTNHLHLQLTTIDDEVWKIMHRLLSNYARAFNEKHSYSGHLFESRYTSCLITNERYFLEVSRYIHLNPVKAMLVQHPLDYPYSSYPNYVGGAENVDWAGKTLVDTSKVLDSFRGNRSGQDAGQQVAIDEYRRFVEGTSAHKEQEKQIQSDMKENDLWLP